MNQLTSIIGLFTICAAIASVFFMDDIRWMDASCGIAAGAGLIYVKNNSIVKDLKDIVK